jgi:hypothetical protein
MNHNYKSCLYTTTIQQWTKNEGKNEDIRRGGLIFGT